MLVTIVNGITNSVKFGSSRRHFFGTQGIIKTYGYVLANARSLKVVPFNRLLMAISVL